MKKNLFISCLILNTVIWLSGILYLLLKSPIYTSEWILTLPGKGKSTSLNLPEIGEADSRSDSPYNFYADPRENYSTLAKNQEVLREAALIVGMDVEEFGKPRIKIVDNTTMMDFDIDGATAEIAKKKALALNWALQNQLNQLRKAEVEESNRSLELVLQQSQDNLQKAKDNLSAYQKRTLLNRKQQLDDISTNIEDLRKSRSHTLAEIEQVNAFLTELSTEIGLSAKDAAEAIALQSNSVFREYLTQ